MSRLKTVYFLDDEWTLNQAMRWIDAHNVEYYKIKHEGNQWRFVVRPKEEFSHFITKKVQSKFIRGKIKTVYLVIGFP
jgi:hypothetical protein